MIRSACLGFSRTGIHDEMPKALREYINGEITENDLLNVAQNVKKINWEIQKKMQIDIIPSNDFSFCDQMLDSMCLFGNIHRRYYWEGGKVPLNIYFAMIRGQQKEKFDVLSMETEHWFNTNYLYFVPEISDPVDFSYSDNKPIVEYLEAKKILQMNTRPVIMGPISYLLLSKSKEDNLKPLDYIDDLLKVYEELFINFKRTGVTDVQIDEPCLSFEILREVQSKYTYAYSILKKYAKDIKIHLTTFYGNIRDNLDLISSLTVDSIHIDVPNNYNNIDDIINKISKNYTISLGLIDANNVFINNIQRSLDIANKFLDKFDSNNIIVSTSSSLFLCPFSKKKETNLNHNIEPFLSFVDNKLEELKLIKNCLNLGTSQFQEEIKNNKKFFDNNGFIKKLILTNFVEQNSTDSQKKIILNQNFNHKERKAKFNKKHNIVNIPMTIIGGLPNFQKDDSLKEDVFLKLHDIKKHIKENVELQEKLNFDIICSGDLEKTTYDHCAYLSSFMGGVYLLTSNKVPKCGYHFEYPYIIYDDLSINIKSIYSKTVVYVQSLTKKLVKASIPGPISFVNKAFIPDHFDRSTLYTQAVEIIRHEFKELVDHDVKCIQINELELFSKVSKKTSLIIPSIRDTLFKVSKIYNKLNDDVKVILYTGYFDFTDSIEELCKMDIDVLFLESAKSSHEILSSFISFKPSIDIGLGVCDPLDGRISTKQEIFSAAKKMLMFFDTDQVWMIPDCEFIFKKDMKEATKTMQAMSSAIKDIRNHAKQNDKF